MATAALEGHLTVLGTLLPYHQMHMKTDLVTHQSYCKFGQIGVSQNTSKFFEDQHNAFRVAWVLE